MKRNETKRTDERTNERMNKRKENRWTRGLLSGSRAKIVNSRDSRVIGGMCFQSVDERRAREGEADHEKERWRQVVGVPEIPVTEPKPFYWTRARWMEARWDDAQSPRPFGRLSATRSSAVPRYFLSRPAEIIQLLNIRLFSTPDIRIRRASAAFRVASAMRDAHLHLRGAAFRMRKFCASQCPVPVSFDSCWIVA